MLREYGASLGMNIIPLKETGADLSHILPGSANNLCIEALPQPTGMKINSLPGGICQVEITHAAPAASANLYAGIEAEDYANLVVKNCWGDTKPECIVTPGQLVRPKPQGTDLTMVNDTDEGIIEGMGDQFTRENIITPPPVVRYVNDNESKPSNRIGNCTIGEYIKHEPPTLEQRLKRREATAKHAREAERSFYHKKRNKPDFFGQPFEIAVEYKGTVPTKKVDDIEVINRTVEVGLSNRFALYRYLQEWGLAVIDDNAINHEGARVDTSRSQLLLPGSTDLETYYALEDEVREQYPFVRDEIRLYELLAEQAGQEFDIEALAASPEKMHELVDELSMDERFAGFFIQGEALREARRGRRRVDVALETGKDPSRSVIREIVSPEDRLLAEG